MDEEYYGVIKQWAGHRCPNNYMFCEGQTLSIKDNMALFSIIGTSYGGDGVNNFKLPDLRPKRESHRLADQTVVRSRESGDPGNFGFVNNPLVITQQERPEWGDSPKYIICVYGLYPSFD